MTVIEPGPGMGFFTLEAARLVGTGGKVIALDVQDRMIEALRKRLDRAGLVSRVELRTVEPGDLGIRRKGIADFFLAFAMVHEVPDPRRFFEQAYDLLRAGGRLLLAEPSGHISETVFARGARTGSRDRFQDPKPPRHSHEPCGAPGEAGWTLESVCNDPQDDPPRRSPEEAAGSMITGLCKPAAVAKTGPA